VIAISPLDNLQKLNTKQSH